MQEAKNEGCKGYETRVLHLFPIVRLNAYFLIYCGPMYNSGIVEVSEAQAKKIHQSLDAREEYQE